MQAKQVGNDRWALVLAHGEDVLATVTSFLEEKGIKGGFVVGLGSVENPTVGYYDLTKKEYQKRSFTEVMELGGLTGTIGMADGKPFLHAHVTICGPELIAFTGHLVKAEVGATVELMLTDLKTELPREMNDEIGLKLFRLESEPAGE